jgi:hypothetical protein
LIRRVGCHGSGARPRRYRTRRLAPDIGTEIQVRSLGIPRGGPAGAIAVPGVDASASCCGRTLPGASTLIGGGPRRAAARVQVARGGYPNNAFSDRPWDPEGDRYRSSLRVRPSRSPPAAHRPGRLAYRTALHLPHLRCRFPGLTPAPRSRWTHWYTPPPRD